MEYFSHLTGGDMEALYNYEMPVIKQLQKT